MSKYSKKAPILKPFLDLCPLTFLVDQALWKVGIKGLLKGFLGFNGGFFHENAFFYYFTSYSIVIFTVWMWCDFIVALRGHLFKLRRGCMNKALNKIYILWGFAFIFNITAQDKQSIEITNNTELSAIFSAPSDNIKNIASTKSNIILKIKNWFQDNAAKIKGVKKHVATHFVVYFLGGLTLYYHILNKEALYSLYKKKSLSQESEGFLEEMCSKLNIERNKLKVFKGTLIKNSLIPSLFGNNVAHIVGTDGIIFGFDPDTQTIAHELTHIKNKHAYIIITGAFLSPIVVDMVCDSLIKVMDKYKGNNKILKKVIDLGKLLISSPIFRGAMSFICALKILHACEHNADVSYAKELCYVSDLGRGKTRRRLTIPVLNIDIFELWHPPSNA